MEKNKELLNLLCKTGILDFEKIFQDSLKISAENGHTECVKLLIPVSDHEIVKKLKLINLKGEKE